MNNIFFAQVGGGRPTKPAYKERTLTPVKSQEQAYRNSNKPIVKKVKSGVERTPDKYYKKTKKKGERETFVKPAQVRPQWQYGNVRGKGSIRR